MEAAIDMGQYGGVVNRTLTLLGDKLKPRTEVSGETLLKVPVRNRRALRDSGFMSFFDKPRAAVKKAITKSVKPKKGMKILFNRKVGLITRISPAKKLMWVEIGGEVIEAKLKNVKEVKDG